MKCISAASVARWGRTFSSLPKDGAGSSGTRGVESTLDVPPRGSSSSPTPAVAPESLPAPVSPPRDEVASPSRGQQAEAYTDFDVVSASLDVLVETLASNEGELPAPAVLENVPADLPMASEDLPHIEGDAEATAFSLSPAASPAPSVQDSFMAEANSPSIDTPIPSPAPIPSTSLPDDLLFMYPLDDFVPHGQDIVPYFAPPPSYVVPSSSTILIDDLFNTSFVSPPVQPAPTFHLVDPAEDVPSTSRHSRTDSTFDDLPVRGQLSKIRKLCADNLADTDLKWQSVTKKIDELDKSIHVKLIHAEDTVKLAFQHLSELNEKVDSIVSDQDLLKTFLNTLS